VSTHLFVLLLLALDAGVPAAPGLAPGLAPPVAPGSAAAPETAPPPKGPPPDVVMACAPSPVKVGQVLTCTLTITHPADVSITVTAPPAFRTLTPAPDEALPDGRLKAVRALQVQPLEPKESLKIAGLRVIWRESTGGEGAVDVPEQRVAITRMLVGELNPEFHAWGAPGGDPAAFFERHGPLPFRVTNWPLLIGIFVVVGVGLGVGVGFIVRRWLDARRTPPGPPVDPRPAHIIALEALDALSEEAQTVRMEVKFYYSRLSEIIRAYLERRYHFTALEMTSDEIRRQIREMDPGYEARLAIDRFLDETDLVKFAAHLPGSGEADTVMLAARGLIQITRLSDQALQEEAAS